LLVLAATTMGALVRPSEASSNREDEMRAQIAQLLNGERTNRGLRPLPIDQGLQDSAQAWSEHNRDAGCETGCHSTHSEGEILAWGDVNAHSGKLVVAWMQSVNHRNIVLYPDTTSFGVGVACKHGGEVYATVQFHDVYRPVPGTDQDPIATSEDWGTPCEGASGSMPTTTTTSTTQRPTTTTTTRPPRTTTTAAPRPAAPPTTARRPPPQPAAAAVTHPTTAPPPPTTTTVTVPPTTTPPRIALRADSTGITADPTSAEDEATLFAESTATPANAEPAWIAIVVVVVLLSGMRIAAQLQELRAARRLEDG
jgi:hypothetical protein